VGTPRYAEYFEGREKMATWTRAQGWQWNAEVTAKCLKKETDYLNNGCTTISEETSDSE
jgi:hypothetical protein